MVDRVDRVDRGPFFSENGTLFFAGRRVDKVDRGFFSLKTEHFFWPVDG